MIENYILCVKDVCTPVHLEMVANPSAAGAMTAIFLLIFVLGLLVWISHRKKNAVKILTKKLKLNHEESEMLKRL